MRRHKLTVNTVIYRTDTNGVFDHLLQFFGAGRSLEREADPQDSWFLLLIYHESFHESSSQQKEWFPTAGKKTADEY